MSSLPLSVTHALRGPHRIGEVAHEGPPPAGLLHGDRVDPVTLTLKARDTKALRGLVGILDLVSRTRYGVSSRGVPQFLFHPLDTRYPPMIVGSKAPTTANQWAVVNFDTWTIPKDKWPRGALQELLGPTGDVEVEQAALRRQVLRGYPTTRVTVSAASPVSPTSSPPSSSPSSSCGDSLVENILSGPLELWDTVLNVDPEGCRDVDDVIGWRRNADGTLEVFIGIANVAAHVAEGSSLDAEARRRGQTVYEEGRVLAPMLPTELSEVRASLLADGVPRGVVAAVWTVSLSGRSEHTATPTFRAFRVVNRHTYTYDSILADTEVAETLQGVLGAITLPAWSTRVRAERDPHVWIEAAMVTYNAWAAARLRLTSQTTRTGGLLRVHGGAKEGGTPYAALAAQVGMPELALLGLAAGRYCSVAAEEAAEGHSGLGLPLYCHASSPLRRYADLVNQRVLLASLTARGEEEDVGSTDLVLVASTLAASLNDRAKEIKRFERLFWCSQHMMSDHPIGPRTAVVLGWKRLGGCEARLKVYVSAWRQTVGVRVLCEEAAISEELTLVRLLPEGRKGYWRVTVGALIHIRGFLDAREAAIENRYVFEVSW